LLMVNVVVTAIEANTIAIYGKGLAAGVALAHRELLQVAWSSFKRGLPVILLGTPALLMLYGLRDNRWFEASAFALVLMLVPVVGCLSAVASGALIASQRVVLPIGTQGLRSLVPLVTLSLWDVSLLLLCVLYLIGECMRLLIL